MIADIIMLIGSIFILISTIGCMRFRDFYTKLHAAGVGDSFGCIVFIIGMIIKFADFWIALKLLLLIGILLVTNPTSTHILIKLARKIDGHN